MKINYDMNVNSANSESISIAIEYNPQNPEEEKLAAFVITLTDLVKSYHRLNTLTDEHDAEDEVDDELDEVSDEV